MLSGADLATPRYYDKDNKFGSITATPLEFSKKYAGPYPFTESFSLINDPRNDYGKLYTVDRLGNVWGGRKVLCEWLCLRLSIDLANKPLRRQHGD